MSHWDNLLEQRRKQNKERGPHNSAFTYTFSFVSSPRRLWRMLTFEERGIWTKCDIADLAQFCEDFVLFDHIGVSGSFTGLVGPDLFYAVAAPEDYPLFDYTEQIDAALQALRRHDENRAMLKQRGKRAELEVLPIPEELLRGLIPLLASDDDFAKRAAEICLLLARENRKSVHNLISSVPLREDDQWLRTPADIKYMANELIRASTLLGLSVSPGSSFGVAFKEASTNSAFTRRAYSEIASAHRELANKLQSWTTMNSVEVPPLLGILLSRCKSRSSLIPQLIAMRTEFSDLRVSLRDTQKSFDTAASLTGQMRAVERIEMIRRDLLAKATKSTTTSIVQRTWSVVKKGSISGSLMQLADLTLELGRERRLLGGLRRFVDIERLAMSNELPLSSVTRLFGTIQSD